MPRKQWSRDELILSLNLYLKLPYGKLHSRTPEVIHLANITHRSPSSIAIRLSNYASVDPFHQQRGVVGLVGGRKQVEPIWNEFINNREELLFESERILATLENVTLEEKYSTELEHMEDLKGIDKIREVKTRINQHLFRRIVIANYSEECAITGKNIPDLLLASHIIPWSKSEIERLNPENGICLSPLYDRAYDRGYIGIDQNYSIILSPKLKEIGNTKFYSQNFAPLNGQKIKLPKKYHPKKEFLQYHMDLIFKGE